MLTFASAELTKKRIENSHMYLSRIKLIKIRFLCACTYSFLNVLGAALTTPNIVIVCFWGEQKSIATKLLYCQICRIQYQKAGLVF